LRASSWSEGVCESPESGEDLAGTATVGCSGHERPPPRQDLVSKADQHIGPPDRLDYLEPRDPGHPRRRSAATPPRQTNRYLVRYLACRLYELLEAEAILEAT